MQLYGSSRVGNRIHTRHLLQEPLGGTKLPDRWSAGDYASLAALLGGAAVNIVSLAVGVHYADFADDAKFGWVTDLGEPSCRGMMFCLSDCWWYSRRPWES
ncbi:MAG TPA: hypothetical protein VK390_06635 [Propionibacteriaceae bacterium]|nr:hypothetical protein [Propionibacteriaceae bacterium]